MWTHVLMNKSHFTAVVCQILLAAAVLVLPTMPTYAETRGKILLAQAPDDSGTEAAQPEKKGKKKKGKNKNENKQKEKTQKEKNQGKGQNAKGKNTEPAVLDPQTEQKKNKKNKKDRKKKETAPGQENAKPATPVSPFSPPPKKSANEPKIEPKDNFKKTKGKKTDGPATPPQTFSRPSRDVIKKTYIVPPKNKKKVDDIKKTRKESVAEGGKVRLIEESDKRVIVRSQNSFIIHHDESERFRRVSRNAKTIRRSDGGYETVLVRDGGVRVYNIVDRRGHLLYRYRRDRFGRDVILIDNRPYYRRWGVSGKDLVIGLAVGAAIVALAPPVIAIARDKYIVDYGRASDYDLYEALTAPPVERIDRAYALDEIRYSESLRQRMRRVDLDTLTFDFGSWDIDPSQYRNLERIADNINRALENNPDEVFLIEGHTDAVGTEEDNLSLSDRRAQTVAEILTSEFGVPPENLVTQGYGEQYLKVPTEMAERANRRIAIRRITPLMANDSRDYE